NKGTGDFYRLRAMTKSENVLWDKREFVFGRVAAGESRTWSLPVKIPKDTHTRFDLVTVKFFEGDRELPNPVDAQVEIEGLPRPVFGYSFSLNEVDGNGDGLIQPGETFELKVTAKNVGEGKALETLATLKNVSGK